MVRIASLVISAVALVVGACGGGSTASSGTESAATVEGLADSTVTLQNSSSFALFHFYMSPVDQQAWGPDQFGPDVLMPGESFTLTEIDCGTYDVKIVDEDGDECVVGGVDVCLEDAGWNISDEDLATCQIFTPQGS